VGVLKALIHALHQVRTADRRVTRDARRQSGGAADTSEEQTMHREIVEKLRRVSYVAFS
jgi:hypothetical protein